MQEAQAGVQAALEMAAEELSSLIERARSQGAEAYAAGDYKTFERVDRQREALETFQQRFAALRQEWGRLGRGQGQDRRKAKPSAPQRARRGEILHEREYVFPILRALRSAGGAAPIQQVLTAVEREVAPRLTPQDRGTLGRGEIRWRNRAQWVRKDLVDAGLMASHSRQGMWEITEAGRRELEQGDLERTWERIRKAQRAR